jgi:opacity protein-like surface antigen
MTRTGEKLMRRILFLMATVIFVSVSARAQDHPKVEFWGTYAITVADVDVLDNETLQGYGLGIQGNLNKWFGLVGEFSSGHGASGPVTIQAPPGFIVIPELDTRIIYYLFGPRVSYRTKPVTVFGHLLVGGGNVKLNDEKGTGISDSNTEFAFAIGGGVDVNLGKRFAIRAAQFDYAPIHTDINARVSGGDSSWLNNSRFQAGFVVKLGN